MKEKLRVALGEVAYDYMVRHNDEMPDMHQSVFWSAHHELVQELEGRPR